MTRLLQTTLLVVLFLAPAVAAAKPPLVPRGMLDWRGQILNEILDRLIPDLTTAETNGGSVTPGPVRERCELSTAPRK